MSESLVSNASLEVRWGDQDAFGHVNHACFATYFEHARYVFFKELGIELDQMRAQGEGPILARLACDYRQELSCGDQLRVETTTAKVGHSSFHLRQVLYRNGLTEPAAEAEVVLVWFDYFTRQTQGLAPAVREWLMRYHRQT